MFFFVVRIYVYSIYIIHIYIYTCKLYKLINLCWSTSCFVKLHFTPRDDFIDGFSTVNIQDLAGCAVKINFVGCVVKSFLLTQSWSTGHRLGDRDRGYC